MQGRASSCRLLPDQRIPVHLTCNSLVTQHHVEVCPLSRGMILPADSLPIRPMTGRPSLAPRSHTRSPLGSPCGALSQPERWLRSGGLRAYHVPRECLCRLGLASPPVVHHLRQVSEKHLNLTTCLLAPASQHLWLVIDNGVYQRFTSVDPTTPS